MPYLQDWNVKRSGNGLRIIGTLVGVDQATDKIIYQEKMKYQAVCIDAVNATVVAVLIDGALLELRPRGPGLSKERLDGAKYLDKEKL